VRPIAPAVEQDVGIDATGFLQRIREHWHPVESFVGVDALGERADSVGEPSEIKSDAAKWERPKMS